MYTYTDEKFNNPLKYINKNTILTAKFTPFECGFAILESKNKPHILQSRYFQIKLHSLYLNEQDKLDVKHVDFSVGKTETFNDFCFRTDINDLSNQIICSDSHKKYILSVKSCLI